MSERKPGPGGEERRRYFRVVDDVHLELRIVSADQYARVRAEPPAEGDACDLMLQLRALTSQAGAILAGVRKSHPDIAQFLALQERKFDLLARALVGKSLDRELAPNARVDLGAGGVGFPHTEELPVDTPVLVRLVLFPSHLCVQSYGRVVYCRREPQGGPKPFRIGVEFTVIGEVARDALVRHTLERQSAMLRRQRGH